MTDTHQELFQTQLMGIVIPQQIETLGRLYEIELGAAEYLAANRHLIPFLEEMAPVLASYFPDAPLQLRLERDPETGRELELWALGSWQGEGDDWMQASNRLDTFRRQWWLEHSRLVRHQIAVNFEFAEANVT